MSDGMDAGRRAALVETLVLRSKRIRWGAHGGHSHSWFKDGKHYVPLCAECPPQTFRGVAWGDETNPHEACVAYLESILEERHQRRRGREAERRRERYNEDPVVRARIKENNKAYLKRRKTGEPDAGEVFDKALAAYRKKWAMEAPPDE